VTTTAGGLRFDSMTRDEIKNDLPPLKALVTQIIRDEARL
jgi:hypothetical protein